jgi:competence protein ComEC
MIGVVLMGVLFDRPALTMRTLTIAALVVLLFAPESIVLRASRCRLPRRWR